MLELGKKIKELRKKRNYSARELSERSGVARSLISQLETGNRKSTSVDTIYRLAKALDAPLSYFVSDEPCVDYSATYKQAHDSHWVMNEESLPYLNTIQKAKKAGITPDLLDQLIDVILRIRQK